MKQLNCKTLVIAGTNDMIKDSHTRFIYENLPDAQLVLVKGTHFIANENYEEFNQAAERFLQVEL